jgi:tetratricopeptide (TPR) repeat protein
MRGSGLGGTAKGAGWALAACRIAAVWAALATGALAADAEAPAEAEDVEAEPPAAETAGKAESPMQREIRYATGLVELGLPDYAQTVMDQVSAKYPEAKVAVFRLRIDALASQGKFDQAEAEIVKLPANTPEAMAARLLVSDRYYQFGKLAKARQGYEAVLGAYGTAGPPAELRDFYAESAYKYAQMLIAKDDVQGAIKALQYILSAKPEPYVKRKVQTEKAELLLRAADGLKDNERKKTIKDASDLAKEVMWGGMDDLFGRALVIMAHSAKLSGNAAEARKLIGDWLPRLKAVEDAMKEAKVSLRESPMAQCKYLLGTLHEEEGRGLVAQSGKDAEINSQFESALSQYFTVVMRYPGSPWAPDACQRIEGLMALLNERGRKIDLPPGVDLTSVQGARYKEAKALFQDGNFAEAAKRYVQALNLAPGYADAVSALSDLSQCYLQDSNERFARATFGYLAERFCQDPALSQAAGNALLGVAQAFTEAGQGPAARDVFVLFTDKFADHERAPAVLQRLGDAALRVTNYVEALPMYQRITQRYNKPGVIYNSALDRQARCQTGLGDHSNAVQTLKLYYGQLPNGAEKVAALVRIADSYRQIENGWEVAANAYGAVVNALSQPNHALSPTAEDAERNRKAREHSLYYRAFCYSRIKDTPEKTAANQDKAIEAYEAFLKENPKSELAPAVLSAIGTLYYLKNNPEKAQEVFNRLTKEYPGHELTKNVLYAQVESLLQLGRAEKAGEVAAKMLDSPQTYTPAQFLKVGAGLLDAKLAALAARAFAQARTVAERAIWEPASLGLGQALVAAGQSAEASKPIEEMLRKYPNSGYLVQANQILGRAYAAAAQTEGNAERKKELFKKAMAAIMTARRFIKDSGTQTEMDMELATIQLAMGDKGKALASYQRVFLSLPSNPKTIACMEAAFAQIVPMLLETKRYSDARETIDSYLKTFPNGKHVVECRVWLTQIPTDSAAPATPAAPVVAEPAAAPAAEPPVEPATPPPTAPTAPAAPAAPAPAAPVAPAPAAGATP